MSTSKVLPVAPGDLETLAKHYGTPLQLYDEKTILDAISRLYSAFRSAGFKCFRNFYAVKALPNPAILSLVKAAGCGFDCSSRTELQIASQLGARGDDIMYTSNFTSEADLRLALQLNAIINIDDVSVLDTLLRVRGKQGCPSLLCFRLNPGVGKTASDGTQSNVLGGPQSKFGMSSDVIVEAFKRAHAAGARRFGIHMMAGSCVTDGAVAYWAETMSVLAGVCRRVIDATKTGFAFVNVGGGLGVPYKENESGAPVEAVASKLREIFDASMLDTGLEKGVPPVLYMENGRFLTGPAGYLVARCHAAKRNHFGNTFYGLDACMAHLMRPGMYNSYHHVTVPCRDHGGTESNLEVANVVGTLCENNDWFARNRLLPRAEAGDLFVVHDTGAHSHSMGFNYNGALRAPEVLLRKTYYHREKEDSVLRHVDLIRKRETFQTLFGNTIIPSDLATAGDVEVHGDESAE